MEKFVEIKKKFYTEIWYENVSFENIFTPVVYRQSKGMDKKIGFFQRTTQTKIRSIKNESEELITKLPAKTRNEIRRARKEGVKSCISPDMAEFISMHEAFVKARNLDVNITINSLNPYKDKLLTTKAVYMDRAIVAHMYILDPISLRARLLYSIPASEEKLASIDKKIIGYSNRLLHFDDMLILANLGFETYDLGGYSFDKDSSKMANINKFKDEFGDMLVKESSYESFAYAMLMIVKRWFR